MFEKCTTKNTVMWLLHPRCGPIWAKMSVNTLLDLYMNRSLNLSSWWTRPLLAEIQSFSYFRSLKLLTITRLYSKLGCNVTGCVDVYTTFWNRLIVLQKTEPSFPNDTLWSTCALVGVTLKTGHVLYFQDWRT